ncbi:MAG: hypothetical protein K2O06_15710 [Acetatifactor sp.]|nr:hypothetical protein [Acetatifactor sp.]
MDVYANGQHSESSDAAIHAGEPVDLRMEQEEPKALKTVEELKRRLSEKPNDVETAIQVAKDLSSLCGNPGIEAQQAVAALGYLQAEYGEVEEVLEELARGLALLIACTDEMTGFVYKGWLQGLLAGYPKLADVVSGICEIG